MSGKYWGLNNTTATSKTSVSDSSSKSGSLRYYSGTQVRDKALKYSFELPEGDYDLTFGYKNPWSGRNVNMFAEGTNLSGDYSIGSYNAETEVTYNKIHVLVYSADSTYTKYSVVFLTLHRDPGECRSLAETIFQQTAGNPYYVTQMLQSLYHDRLIYFNEEMIRCEWDLRAIKEREGSNDVLQLLVERFDKLPEQARSVLRVAACIGNAFPLSLLSSVCEQSLSQTEFGLSFALYEGLVLISNDQQTHYMFLHDRVQQAFYHFLSETEIKQNHLAIGRILSHSLCTHYVETASRSLDPVTVRLLQHTVREIYPVDLVLGHIEINARNL